MTPEEAVKIINGAYSLLLQSKVNFNDLTDYRTASEVATNALKKQIPMKPILKTDEDFNEIYKVNADYYVCPVCGARLREYEHHCYCGQKMDWSEE